MAKSSAVVTNGAEPGAMPLPPMPMHPMGEVVNMPSPKSPKAPKASKAERHAPPEEQDEPEAKAPKVVKPPSAKKPGKRPTIEVNPLEVVKLQEQLGAEATAALDDMDLEQLKAHLALLAEHEEETEQAFKRDDEIKELKSQLSEMKAPYRETLVNIRRRRRLSVLLMQTRGSKAPPPPA